VSAPLDSLHNFYQPPPPSWMPQTISWYVVFVLIAAAIIWTAVHFIRKWFANRYRREALRELPCCRLSRSPRCSNAPRSPPGPAKRSLPQRRCMARISQYICRRRLISRRTRKLHRRAGLTVIKFIQRRGASSKTRRRHLDQEASCTGLNITGCSPCCHCPC